MTQTLVRDLVDRVSQQEDRNFQVELGNLEFTDDASHLRIIGSNQEYEFGPVAEKAFARYLRIPGTYLHQISPQLKAINLNARLSQWAESEATVQIIGDQVYGVVRADRVLLPVSDVVGVISRVLDPEFEVRRLLMDDKRFHVDVLTPHHIEVAPRSDDAIEGRSVGDITHGGLRFLANPGSNESPSITRYFERLWCANGCSSPVEAGTIKLKGRTVPEILGEMEQAAQDALAHLDEDLSSYAAMAQEVPPGNPLAFTEQLLREAGVRGRVRDRVIDLVEILPEDASLYDIQNVFTQVANNDGITYRTMRRLHRLGGDMALDTEHVLGRCSTCERLL